MSPCLETFTGIHDVLSAAVIGQAVLIVVLLFRLSRARGTLRMTRDVLLGESRTVEALERQCHRLRKRNRELEEDAARDVLN